MDAHSPSLDPASILIVDDNPANLKALSHMLAESGYKARPVPGGALALQAAAASPPDLILLDINMPGTGGRSQNTSTRVSWRPSRRPPRSSKR